MLYEFNGFKPVVHPSAFVHPQAVVTGNVVIGKDVYIGPGAALRGDWGEIVICLLYTSDAAGERSSVDLGGRRIIKKKNSREDHVGGVRRENERT